MGAGYLLLLASSLCVCSIGVVLAIYWLLARSLYVCSMEVGAGYLLVTRSLEVGAGYLLAARFHTVCPLYRDGW